MSSTRIRRPLSVPRERVFRALTDARAIARSRVPPGMRSEVHAFGARAGGAIRMSLTCDAPDEIGWRESLARLAALVEAGDDAGSGLPASPAVS